MWWFAGSALGWLGTTMAAVFNGTANTGTAIAGFVPVFVGLAVIIHKVSRP